MDKAGGVSIKLSLGASKSRSTTDRNASTAFGSTAAAGHNLTIIATGAGRDSDINLTGSNLSAGNSALLKAEDGILLQAARNTTEQKTVSKSSNASIGIGYTTGGQQNGFTLELGASLGRGKAQGEDESWTHSRVTAGNVLAIQSGGGTTLKGATGQARQVIASVGGDLLLESLQDSSQYASSNKSAGFGVSLCIPPYCVGSSSVSANVSTGKINSNFRSVTEQTGLRAGDGGLQIDVQNNTKLIGSVIASSDRAIAGGLNHLGTGTLVTEDIGNRAKYSGSQVSIGGGFGFGGGKGADTGLGTSKDGDVAGGASKQHGSSVATDGNGFGMGTPVVVAARGSGGSTTQSAISAGALVIRDEAAQQDLTGMTATQAIAVLNRDTSSDTLNALKPIFDKEKIEAGFEIASEAQRQTEQFLANRAAKAKALEEAVKGAPEGPRKEQLRAQYEAAQRWGPGGRYREALTAVSLATGANVTGSASGFVQAATVNYLQSLSATKIKEIAPLLGGEGSAGHVALHALLGCAGAAATSTSCGAAATGASAGIVISQLVEQVSGKPSSKLDPVEREARINLVTSVLTGLTAALDPKAVVAVNDAARLELENNQLALPLPAIGAASAGGALGGLGRDTNGVTSANENIARHLTRAWNRLFEKDSGPEEANGPLETPAVPPGGDTRVPGYAEDGRHAQGTPGYEADQGSLGTPSYDADGNAYLGGSVTPMPEPQGPQIILNEAQNSSSALQGAKDLFSSNTRGTVRSGKSVFTELPNTGNAAIFSGATDAQVKQYFIDLSGVSEIPVARIIPGRGRIYVVKTPKGNFTLRDFGTSSE
ncbi:hemagglutinin repeat-containing protein [Achromobacter pulmonis]|uniref:hemagglutinin repeat-containing protein n=1 Tax=Achromobacter pulmonis TaxID=1389932 RepID=UPI001C2EC474